MPTLLAIVALLTRIAEAVEAPRDARRRGYGVADLLTMAEAAQLCHMRREDFQTWSLAQGLHRMVAGRGPFVVAGELLAAMERVPAPETRRGVVRPRLVRGTGLAGLPSR